MGSVSILLYGKPKNGLGESEKRLLLDSLLPGEILYTMIF